MHNWNEVFISCAQQEAQTPFPPIDVISMLVELLQSMREMLPLTDAA
jgi:hypothetical protein